ncbi:MAG: NYN domain-containing protein [candidate division WOR-3 bacterium]
MRSSIFALEPPTLAPTCIGPREAITIASAENGIDAHVVTHLFTSAWENVYDVGILVTNDADFVPAVERIQEKGIKIINAKWRDDGFELSKICWASFDPDDLIAQMQK